MTTDFKASQVQTHKVIVTGSFAGGSANQLLIYSKDADDSGSPNQGLIDLTKFDTSGVGSDVFLFVSGGISTKDAPGSRGITAIGGDLHVSGNLSADPGSVLANHGIKYWLESTDNIIVPSRYQYLTAGVVIIDVGGTLTADIDGQIAVV